MSGGKEIEQKKWGEKECGGKFYSTSVCRFLLGFC